MDKIRTINTPTQTVDKYKNKEKGYTNIDCVINMLWQSYGKSNQKGRKLRIEYKRQINRLYRIARRRKEL